MKLVKTTTYQPDLKAGLPPSAPDYYALANAEMMRPRADIFCLEGGFLTVDYSRNWQYQFSVHLRDGTKFSGARQLYDLPMSETVVKIDGTVAVAEDRFTKFNVCHFLLDKLGRVQEYSDLPIESYVVFDQNNYVKNVCSLLDIALTSLPENDEPIVTYQFDTLYLSSSVFKYIHPGQNYRSEVLDAMHLLNKQVEVNSKSDIQRIYIDRSNSPSRKIVNNDEFLALLKRYNFNALSIEDYTFEEQVNLFRGANVVIGVHGAGLTNMVFSEPGKATMLEVLPPLCATSDYWKLAAAYGFSYDAFIADDLDHPRPDYSTWEHDPKTFNRQDVFINIERFEKFLQLNIDEHTVAPSLCIAS